MAEYFKDGAVSLEVQQNGDETHEWVEVNKTFGKTLFVSQKVEMDRAKKLRSANAIDALLDESAEDSDTDLFLGALEPHLGQAYAEAAKFLKKNYPQAVHDEAL
jgi:hypothetical protein